MPVILNSPVPPSMPLSTIVAGSLMDRAAILLNDEDNDRWTRLELLGWLNEGQRAIVQINPASNNKIVAMKLQPGARQAVPADGWLLLNVTRNLGPDGSTPGPMVQLVSRDLLSRFDLNWYSSTPSSTTENYMYAPTDQPSFYVYPPSTGINYLEVNYSFLPDDVAAEEDVINIRDVYGVALLNYMMYRALIKDAEAGTADLAGAYYQMFLEGIAGKDKGELESNPNLSVGKGTPAARGGSK